MSNLVYRPLVHVEDLAVGECTIHRAGDGSKRWWLLWFYVPRTTDGVAADFCVPVNPNGPPIENGPGGRTWSLKKIAPNAWQVSPSINVSLWHQTPVLVNVPDGEPWASNQ